MANYELTEIEQQISETLAGANIGLWSFELDDGAPRFYIDSTTARLVGCDENISPEEAYTFWFTRIDKGSVKSVQKQVAKMRAGSPAEVTYPYHHPTEGTITVRCGGRLDTKYKGIGIRITGYHQDISAVKRREDRLIKLSYTDGLTGILNRQAYEDDTKELAKKALKDNLWFMAFDVNGLKTANDQRGHEAGDEILIGAAKIIEDSVGKLGKVYRTGGDEYMAIVNCTEKEIDGIKDKLLVKEKCWHSNYGVTMSLAKGFVCASELKERTVELMESTADSRMYIEKNAYHLSKNLQKKVSGYDFWDEVGDFHRDVITAITDASWKSYLSVTDLKSKRTWWSKRAVDFFGLEDNYTEVGHEKTRMVMHPEDKASYKASIMNRLKGIDIDVPIEYRVLEREGFYDRFTATCKMIDDKNGEHRLLIIHYDNHGIADEVDSITGLHTEVTLNRNLKEELDANRTPTLLKLGLDNFSRMNVLYGVQYSDLILNIISQKIIAHKPSNSYAYRMQGAKFCVVFEEISLRDLFSFYNDIVEEAANSIMIDGKRVPLKISGGAVIVDSHMKETNDVRSRLTFALTHSREVHHGDLVLFNKEVGCGDTDSLELVNVIHRDAIEKQEGFFLCYQPIVNVETNKIMGMEALIRWKREPYGLVPPSVFIEWIEEDACIFELGNWIIRRAIEDCLKIAKDDPNFFVNVNICPAQLERRELKKKLMAIIADTGIEPGRVCLELTERCRHLDVKFLRRQIEYFKSKGFKVALDDFGTGASSLGLIMDLPLDEIKIDMSFVKDIQNKPFNQEMIRGIIEFANKMGMETCIEGVENQEVRDHLKGYGATWFQGYHYSAPVVAEEFIKLMEK